MRNILSEHNAYKDSLSHCWLLRSPGGSTQPLAGSQADSSFVRGDYSNYSCETYLVIDRIQNCSILSMPATLLSQYEGWLSFSIAHGFSFLPCGIKNGQLLQYSHAYQLSLLANVKMCLRSTTEQ